MFTIKDSDGTELVKLCEWDDEWELEGDSDGTLFYLTQYKRGEYIPLKKYASFERAEEVAEAIKMAVVDSFTNGATEFTLPEEGLT